MRPPGKRYETPPAAHGYNDTRGTLRRKVRGMPDRMREKTGTESCLAPLPRLEIGDNPLHDELPPEVEQRQAQDDKYPLLRPLPPERMRPVDSDRYQRQPDEVAQPVHDDKEGQPPRPHRRDEVHQQQAAYRHPPHQEERIKPAHQDTRGKSVLRSVFAFPRQFLTGAEKVVAHPDYHAAAQYAEHQFHDVVLEEIYQPEVY